MADGEMLEVVNENDEVVGTDTRENIHKKGLLHREVWVQFYTPEGELIFQHRAKDKDTFPDLLDPTVAGHVEIGSDYLSTAVKEVEEEVGLHVQPEDLQLTHMMRSSFYDPATDKTNNTIRALYAYPYSGRVEDLKIEAGKAQGFESWPIEKVLHLTEEDIKRFVPAVPSKEARPMYDFIPQHMLCRPGLHNLEVLAD